MKAIYMSVGGGEGSMSAVPRWSVKTAMTSPVLCVRSDTSLADALRVMVTAGRRHLVVVDEADACVGVVADRALAAAWARRPDALSDTAVADLLDAQPAVVDQNGRLVDAARLMRDSGVDAVAVLDTDRHPVGIVTGSDLVAVLAR